MPSLIDKRLHAAIETKQHETLLRVEGIADKAVALVSRAARDALQLIMDGSVVHRNQREAAEVLNGIIPGIVTLFDQQFRRLHYWSYDETVRILAKQIPRRWFRKVLPAVVMVGETDGFQIPGSNLWADTDTEPVANSGKRLTDSQWADFLKNNLFSPPSREQVERAVYTPVAGQTWRQRLDVLSHKITDMNRLSGILVTGASSGMSQYELKRQIQPVVQNIGSSAARIARTEGLRIATSAQREQYSELDDMLAGVQIIATLDENTRPHHAHRNGRIYWVDRSRKPTIDELPMLPDEPNCRCYDTPVLHPPEEFENDPELRAEFLNAAGDSIPDPQVYGQWFDRADVGRRKQAVGARRYDEVVKRLGSSRPPRFEDFIGDDGALLPVSHLKNESNSDRISRLSSVQNQMRERQVLLQKMSRFGFVSDLDPGVLTHHVSVTFSPKAAELLPILGLSSADVAALTGAKSGAKIHATAYGTTLNISVAHPDYEVSRSVDREQDGSLVIYNDWMKVGVTGKGTGTAVLIHQILNAQKLGAKTLKLKAARSDTMNGYYTWPRLGYNGPVPDEFQKELLKRGLFASDMIDVLAQRETNFLWKELGDSVDLEFDLRIGSKSWIALETYAAMKGIKMERPEYTTEQVVNPDAKPVSEAVEQRYESPPSDIDDELLNEAIFEVGRKLGLNSADKDLDNQNR